MFVRSAQKKELSIPRCEIGSLAFVMRITIRCERSASGDVDLARKKIAGLTYETGNFDDRVGASAVR
jgi:hypothetical protein